MGIVIPAIVISDMRGSAQANMMLASFSIIGSPVTSRSISGTSVIT